MSPVGIAYTYLLGAIFVVGGVIFMFALDDKGLLFGIPYTLIGLMLVYGARGVSRRTRAREAAEAAKDAAAAADSADDPRGGLGG